MKNCNFYLKLTLSSIGIAFENTVEVYNHDFKLIYSFESLLNTLNTIGFSHSSKNIVIGFPFSEKGMIRVQNFTNNTKVVIQAHSSNITNIVFSKDGKLVCTAGEKGTILRVFNCETGEKVKEFRRGISNVNLTSISFSFDNNYLCSVSETGTVHLFSLIDDIQNKTNLYDKYQGNTRGFAEYKIQDEKELFCTFLNEQETKIFIVSLKGNVYKIAYNFVKSEFDCDNFKKISILDFHTEKE